jgi:CheY-like chemotaxis protein
VTRESTNGSARILVVDDESSIVDAVATALRYERFEVREASTGRGVMAAVVEFEPDLVVLDWMLPDVEGIEVGRRLTEAGEVNGRREHERRARGGEALRRRAPYERRGRRREIEPVAAAARAAPPSASATRAPTSMADVRNLSSICVPSWWCVEGSSATDLRAP